MILGMRRCRDEAVVDIVVEAVVKVAVEVAMAERAGV